MNSKQFNELKQHIKHIWINSLNNLNDVTMSISPATTANIISAVIDNTEIENEYILYLTNTNITDDLYRYASNVDTLSYWSGLEKISMYKEKIEEIEIYYLKWADLVEFNISKTEYDEWKKIFITNIRECTCKNLINNEILKVAKFFKNNFDDKVNIINNINDIIDNEKEKEKEE